MSDSDLYQNFNFPVNFDILSKKIERHTLNETKTIIKTIKTLTNF
jgi:hypothetical protein